jgi:hypothetical protein
MSPLKNPHIGSSFDGYPWEEGLLKHCTEVAKDRVAFFKDIIIDGTSIPAMSFPADAPKKPLNIPLDPIELKLFAPSGEGLKPFQDLIEWANKQITLAILGTRHYRQRNGKLECLTPGKARVGKQTFSELWIQIGTTRGPNDNHLRKFAWRHNQLVEVRTRGRTGHRDVNEAALAAGPAPSLS